MGLEPGDRPDRFFTAEQIVRMRELMSKWRTWLNYGGPWSPEEQAELEALVNAELVGATERAKAMLGGKFGRAPPPVM